MADRLAIDGGSPVRVRPFPIANPVDAGERDAVMRVLDSGELSGFVGVWGPDFLGGPEVRACEQAFADYVGVSHAVTVNSATTGLQVAVAAAGVQPGDEVIVPPYTMSATATAVLMNNAIPVFADIEDQTFGLDPASVAERISPATRAILPVHLFGHPAPMEGLLQLAADHDLRVIEDAAQAIGASWRGTPTGAIGDVGVHSLNRHKIIQCGEGGVITTEDEQIARRAQMIRNHGEAVVDTEGGDAFNTLGSNFRMTEIEAAIAAVQLSKLDELLALRRRLAELLRDELAAMPGVIPAEVAPECTHSYYVFPVRVISDELGGLSRDAIVAALGAEGIPARSGYTTPLYRQSLYRTRQAHGSRGCPWTCGHWTGEVNYGPEQCPVTERLDGQELLLLDVCRAPLTEADIGDVAAAFAKVIANVPALRGR